MQAQKKKEKLKWIQLQKSDVSFQTCVENNKMGFHVFTQRLNTCTKAKKKKGLPSLRLLAQINKFSKR